MSWRHLRDSRPIARKPHWCELCGGRIEPGTQYRVRVGADGGDFYHGRMHERCAVVADENYGYDDWEMHDVGCFCELLAQENEKATDQMTDRAVAGFVQDACQKAFQP